VISSAAIALTLSIWLGKSFLNNPRLKKVMLTAQQKSSDGYTSFDNLSSLIGATGITRSMLRPAGKIDINGKLYDAICETGYINANEHIKVIRYETGQLYVTKKHTSIINHH
jgi:membrane-bound serine protease (ClpP class)